jgi:anti-anti-sigma factor
MKIKIWGARGSIPTPLTSLAIREKIITALQGSGTVDVNDPMAIRAYVDSLSPIISGTAGGNTSCVEIQAGPDIIIIDAGSGIRALGDSLLQGPCGRGQGIIHLFFSHTHWDHIQGLPFFKPAFIRGNRINIYSIHDVAPTLADQMRPATFPVSLQQLQATLQFIPLVEDEKVNIGNVHVTNMALPHPGRAYAYRFEYEGAVFVYASDAEYKYLDEASIQPYLRFYAGADALIFDAQFSLRNAFFLEDWGHSSALIGADLARRADVKRLILFHHDPGSSDQDLYNMLEKTIAYIAEQDADTSLDVLLAREGLEIDLGNANACSLRRFAGDNTAILRLVGDLDERVAVELNQQVTQLAAEAENERPALVVDLEATSRLSIAGLRALLDTRQRWGGDPLVLAGPSAHVLRVIELANCLDFFAIYPTLPAALAALEARRTLHLPGQLLKNRYRIEARLGESEVGNVLRATDVRLGRPVVIKVLSSSFSQAATDRFRREAQRMAQLNSPNIVTLFDCDEEEGLVYLVMEYVDGKSLFQLMKQAQASGNQPGLPTLDVAIDILRALEYAHSKGVVHGNLKPENVLVAAEVKLTDFGLRWIEQGRRLTEAPMLVGSPDYLAPEQILGETVEPRTDLYAFGVMLYEMFTGSRPFAAKSAGEILEQHLHQTPVPPRQLRPELSRSLEHLILKLLAKEPDQRYATATQVRRVLMRLERSPLASQNEENFLEKPAQHRTRFIGRDAQLKRLLSLWNLAQKGQGHMVLIAGEVGVGKTRLAEEMLLQAPGATVLVGHCSESEESTPYQPFIEIGRAYLTNTPLMALKPQLADAAPVVATLIPELYDLIANLTPLMPVTAEYERLRLIQGFTQFMERASQARPWLLLLDDLHWADPASLQMLHHLARNISTMPLLILGTYRDVELEANHALQEWRRNLNRYPNFQHIRLNRLDEDGVRQLLHTIWEQGAPPEWTAAIYQRTGGNPFYVEEVAKDLVDQGALTLRDGVWQFAPLVEIKLPSRVHDVILQRVERLSATAQEVLRLATVLGQQFGFHDLLAVTEQSEEQLLESLDELLERDMIRESEGGTTLTFTHGEVQQIIYEDLNPLRRRILHRRVGAALEQAHGDRLDQIASQLAHHFIQSGNEEKGFLYSLKAGHQARQLHAYQTALGWYQDAFAHMPGGETYLLERIELYNGLGCMLQARARYSEAIEAFTNMRRTAEAAADIAAQARAWNRLSDAFANRGDHRQALESAILAEEIASAAGPEAQLELAEAMFHRGWELARLGNVEKALDLGEQVLRYSTELGDVARHQQAMSLNLLGLAHRLLGQNEEAAFYQEQALTIYRELGEHERVGAMLQNLGFNAYTRGDHFTAVILYQEALTIQREIGSQHSEMMILSNLGGARVGLGEYKAGEDDLRQVIQMTESTDRSVFLAETYVFLAKAYAGQGKLAQAMEAIQCALTLGMEMERQEHIALAWQELGNLTAHPDFVAATMLQDWDEHDPLIGETVTRLKDPSACFAESVRIYTILGAEAQKARALHDWARYEIQSGDLCHGEAMWQEAYQSFRRLHMPLEIEQMGAMPARQ